MLNGNWEKEVIAAFCIMLKKGGGNAPYEASPEYQLIDDLK